MLTVNKITKIFVMADEFCKVSNAMLRRRGLSETRKDRKLNYHMDCRMSQAEVIVIRIMFYSSNHKCLKHFYLNEIWRRYRHLFPRTVSYSRFTELEKSVVVQFVIFVKKCLLGECTGISLVDSTLLRACRNQRIHMHKVFKGIAQRGRCSLGWFYGFRLHLICNDKGGLRSMYDRILLRKRAFIESINNELKNSAQIEHSLHRSFPNFIVNLIDGIAAYCLFPKIPMINLERVYDNQLTIF